MGWQSRTIDRFRPVFVSHDPRLKIAETTHRKLLGNRDGAMEAFSTIMDGNYHPPWSKKLPEPQSDFLNFDSNEPENQLLDID